MNRGHRQRTVAYTRDPEDRRPGIRRIYEDVARRHPGWSPERVLSEAKLQWHAERRS